MGGVWVSGMVVVVIAAWGDQGSFIMMRYCSNVFEFYAVHVNISRC